MAKQPARPADVSAARSAAARKEHRHYRAFLDQFELPDTPETVALYLTTLTTQQSNGSALRRRLQLLDTHRRQHGEPPWLTHPVVRSYLRGLHAQYPLADSWPGYDPLYLELVHSLVDATASTTFEQARTAAILLTAHTTGMTAAAMARLTWDDIRLTRTGVTIEVVTRVGRGSPTTIVHTVPASDEPLSLAAALRRLRAHSRAGRFVLGDRGSARDRDRILTALHTLGHPRTTGRVGRRRLAAALAQARALSPAQRRDQALLLLGYSAGLRTTEATALKLSHIRDTAAGLVLAVPGRSHLTYVPRAPDPRYDPAATWLAWRASMASHGLTHEQQPAFPTCNYSRITERSLAEPGLNHVIHQRCRQAGLTGRYVWTSLRTGLIRSAVRAGVRDYAIATHVDLTSLGSVQRHEHREQLLTQNVAGMLGL